MEVIIGFFENYNLEVIMGLSGLLIIIALINLIIFIRMSNKIERYKKQIERSSNAALERSLYKATEDIQKLQVDSKELKTYIDNVNNELGKSIQKIGYTKYDAFNNQGRKLSFSVALLNRKDEGIILTSIYSNGESTSYSKYVKDGQSDVALSAEEMLALDRAMKYKDS